MFLSECAIEQGVSETVWPNWVDLLVITLVLRTGYIGSIRGLLTELFNLFGLVSATALACNFYGVVAQRAAPWWAGDPATLAFIFFVVLFLGSWVVFRVLFRRLADLLKWERLHWTVQLLGMLVGAVRGLWWCTLLMLLMLSVGLPYLAASVQERSIIGPHVVAVGKRSVEWVADRFPGHMSRIALMPSITIRLPKLPETNL